MAKASNDVQQVFTIIGRGTKVVGDMNVDGDTRIDGILEGNINCTGKLIIGLEGKVIGTIECTNLEVLGAVDGTIEVKEKTLLRDKARLTGDIVTSVLNIEPNAVFTGTCDMSGEPKKAKPGAEPAAVVQTSDDEDFDL
ncbi:MAG: polymer-forming cytoskeletal protein [Mangrovibacterium sp.]